MKNKNILWFLLFLVTLNFGCYDEFLEDTDYLTFKAPGIEYTAELEKQLVGAYFIVSNNNGSGGFHENPLLVNNLMADNVQILYDNPNGGDDDKKIFFRESDLDEISRVNKIWEVGYKIANSACLPISYVENNGAPSKPDDRDTTQLDRILGEAYFLRAFAHFTMVKIYAKPYDDANRSLPAIVLKKEAAKSGAGQSVSTIGETYDFIIQDLKKALELLPEKYIDGFHPTEYKTEARVKRDAARFLLAQVYFQMGENATVNGNNAWDEALRLIEIILENPDNIDKRQYAMGEPTAPWLSYGDSDTPDEVVWEYINIEWKNSKIIQSFMANNSPIFGGRPKNRMFPVSNDLMKKAGWEQPFQGSALFDKRYQQLYVFLYPASDKSEGTYFQSLEEPYLWANMFAGYAGKGYKLESGKLKEVSNSEANINTPFFRIAELHLLRATIYAKTGKGNPKYDVDIIRNRAGLVQEIKEAYTLDDIVLEHRREFAFEGKRLDYLRALRMNIPAGDPPDAHNSRTREDLPWDSDKFVWGPPKDEKTRNPNIN